MFVGGVVITLLALWPLLGPRSVWLITESWRYRNPDAVEPSDIAYMLTRIGGGLGVVVGVIMMIAGVGSLK